MGRRDESKYYHKARAYYIIPKSDIENGLTLIEDEYVTIKIQKKGT